MAMENVIAKHFDGKDEYRKAYCDRMKNTDATLEDALSEAQDLAAFLQDVAYQRGLASENKEAAAPWLGLALVHETLVERLKTVSACYYGTSQAATEAAGGE